MGRPWPHPYQGRSKVIQVIGDTHVGWMATGRFQKAIDDAKALGLTPTAALMVGDIVEDGLDAQDAAAKPFFDQLPWPYFLSYGEHDGLNAGRPDSSYLTNWSLPSKTHYADFGWFRAIACPTHPTQAELDTIQATAAATGLPCVLVSHRPIRGSLPGGTSPTYGVQPNTNNTGLYNPLDDEYKAMLNASPNIKVIVCGHTHGALDAAGNASLINVGTRSVIQVNAGAYAYTNTSKGATSDYIPGVYLFWRDSLRSVEIRFREHGGGVWVLGPNSQKVITLPIPN